MFTRMLGPDTASALLKDGLDVSTVRARGIADRIRPMFRSLDIAASGLSAQRARADGPAAHAARLLAELLNARATRRQRSLLRPG